MAEKVRAGQYRVGSKEPSDSREGHKDIGVIKGSAVNDINHGAFRRHMGVKSSKWYVYETEELLVKERNVTTGTFVRNVASLVEECDSKDEAVSTAKRKYRL